VDGETGPTYGTGTPDYQWRRGGFGAGRSREGRAGRWAQNAAVCRGWLRADGRRDFRRLNGLLQQSHAALGPRGSARPPPDPLALVRLRVVPPVHRMAEDLLRADRNSPPGFRAFARRIGTPAV
jgi:hypothetical protein